MSIKGYSNEKYVPIGQTYNMEYILYLTETGKIVSDIGVRGMSIEEGIKNTVLCYGGCSWDAFNQSFSKLTYEQVISQGEKSAEEPNVRNYMEKQIQEGRNEEVILYDLYHNGVLKHYYHYIPKGKVRFHAKGRKVMFYESGKIKSYSYVCSNEEDRVVVKEWYESGMIKSQVVYGEENMWGNEYDENGFFIGEVKRVCNHTELR